MVALTIIDYTLITKEMLIYWGILVALNYVVHLWPNVDLRGLWVGWEEMYLSLDSLSLCETLLPDRHLAVTQLQ